VLTLAQEEARLLGHDHVGTEHVLLGLVHEGEGVGGKALTSFGVSVESARTAVEQLRGAKEHSQGNLPFTPRAKKVLELSLREALQLGHSYIGTEHILLGLTREGEGTAMQVLVSLGVDLSSVRQRVISLMSGYSGERPSERWVRKRGIASFLDDPAASGPEPRCPQCQAGLAAVARYRTIIVSPDLVDSDKEPISTIAVYCSRCGITLHMFKSTSQD
jgi:ATP-dependent Clp protease ATP-binding subunit ClpA